VIVVVKLAAALICFSGQCHPVLVGKDTPVGRFRIAQRMVLAEGYGGDVLMFSEDPRSVLAIHRVWNGRPSERRAQRIASQNAAVRRGITGGCVNVTPEVYAALVDCCSTSVLEIEP